MPYLFRTKAFGRHVKTPLGKGRPKNADQALMARYCQELKKGNRKVIEKICDEMMNWTITIVSRYAKTNKANTDDFLSEALLAVVQACNQVADDPSVMFDDNLAGFLISKIHNACTSESRTCFVLYVPYSTIKRLKNNMTECQPLYQQDLDKVDIAVEFDPKEMIDLRDTLEHCVRTRFDQEIIRMRGEGYLDQEIADKFGVSRQHVSRTKLEIEELFDELTKSYR